MAKLTATGVKAALGQSGRHGDGDGLILAVGSKSNDPWVVRVQKDGKRRDIGLGAASKVTLSGAVELSRGRQADVQHQILQPLLEGYGLALRNVREGWKADIVDVSYRRGSSFEVQAVQSSDIEANHMGLGHSF